MTCIICGHDCSKNVLYNMYQQGRGIIRSHTTKDAERPKEKQQHTYETLLHLNPKPLLRLLWPILTKQHFVHLSFLSLQAQQPTPNRSQERHEHRHALLIRLVPFGILRQRDGLCEDGRREEEGAEDERGGEWEEGTPCGVLVGYGG